MAPNDALTLKHVHQYDLKTHTLKVHQTIIQQKLHSLYQILYICN